MFCISKASLQSEQTFHIISVAVQNTQLKIQDKHVIFDHITISENMITFDMSDREI